MRNIIIHSDFGRKILELTEDELVIKRFLHKKRVKRSNIRSAYMDEESLNILTYDNKLIVIFTSFVKWSERENIKRIIDEVNKGGVIFNLNREVFPWWSTVIYCIPHLLNIIDNWGNKNYFSWFFFIAMVALSAITYKENGRYKGVKYCISERRFIWENNKGEINKSYSLESIKLVKNYDRATKYKIKSSKYTFYIINKINYPLNYKLALEEIRNVTKENYSIKSK